MSITLTERVATRYLKAFNVGDKVVVKDTHGTPAFHGNGYVY